MDDAYNIQRLINVHQMTEQECADAYRASVAWIKGRLALIEATPEVEQAIRSGEIKGTAAKAIAKLSAEHQRNLAKVAQEKGKVTATDIRKETGGSGVPAKPSDAPKLSGTPTTDKLLELADRMYEAFADLYGDEDELPAAAKAYWKARNR